MKRYVYLEVRLCVRLVAVFRVKQFRTLNNECSVTGELYLLVAVFSPWLDIGLDCGVLFGEI
eukprot:m.17527 g.17527  ORF g.17527 m.17527 type:complete len:62 (+) comp27512_c0_seq2:3077-3262(+)